MRTILLATAAVLIASPALAHWTFDGTAHDWGVEPARWTCERRGKNAE